MKVRVTVVKHTPQKDVVFSTEMEEREAYAHISALNNWRQRDTHLTVKVEDLP